MTALERITLESVFLEVRGDLERVIRRRLQSTDIVADLVHDIYLKCRSVGLDFPNRREARAYLLRMASNLAIDHVRVEGRRAVILSDMAPYFEALETSVATPESYSFAADKARQIESALVGLPGLTRQMFILVRLHGLTHKEVAERMGVSKSLVDKYVLQALLRCRDVLGGLDALD
ncbi:RNA polymerase sigma factor [Sphingomonas sp. VNH70]|uniref:RNA polymerase sigma factor n=1 Tax=Sphingomonas silueang TaxID=3156617 RepID=UPI0032B54360